MVKGPRECVTGVNWRGDLPKLYTRNQSNRKENGTNYTTATDTTRHDIETMTNTSEATIYSTTGCHSFRFELDVFTGATNIISCYVFF